MKPVVYVRWADAHTSDAGWLTLQDYSDDGEAIVETVGFFVRPDEEGGKKGHLTLWQTLSEGDGIHGFHIPLGMVREVRVLANGTPVSVESPEAEG